MIALTVIGTVSFAVAPSYAQNKLSFTSQKEAPSSGVVTAPSKLTAGQSSAVSVSAPSTKSAISMKLAPK